MEVAQLNVGEVRIRAPAGARAVTCDDGQWHEPAAATALQIAEPGCQGQLALICPEVVHGSGLLGAQPPYCRYRGRQDCLCSHARLPPTPSSVEGRNLTAY